MTATTYTVLILDTLGNVVSRTSGPEVGVLTLEAIGASGWKLQDAELPVDVTPTLRVVVVPF